MNRILRTAALALCTSLLAACGGAGSMTTSSLLPQTAPATTSVGTTPTTGTTTGTATPTTSTGSSTSTSGSGTSTTGSGTTTTGTTSTTSTSPLPTPPSTATVLNSVQDTTDNWASCSDCAGGSGISSNFWTAPFQTTPSLSGSSRQFYTSGPAWSSVLWYKKLGAQNASSHFLWDFWVYFDSASAAHAWTAEYDLWQSMGGQEFMIGSQCNFGDGEWDLWDSLNGKWIKDSGVPCPRFTPNTWHHIQWYLERVSSTQYRYNTLVVDDVPHALNRTFTANPIDWHDNFGVQWQLDEDSTGTALNEWVDKVTVTLW